jgi:hypothetical protein
MSTSDEATKGLLPRSAQRPFIKHDGFGTPLPPPFGLIPSSLSVDRIS